MSIAFVKTQIEAYIYMYGISVRNMLAQKLENSEHADGA